MRKTTVVRERISARRDRRQATGLWSFIVLVVWAFVIGTIAYLGGAPFLAQVLR